MEKIICTRLDFWAEKNGILSSTQYDFSKGRGTPDCLALLTTDISTLFEIKKPTVVAFLDISTITFSCCVVWVMLEEELPLGIFRFMWNLLSCMTCTGYKGLPQGSDYLCLSSDSNCLD
jgi:hypothetical protein